MTHRKSRISLVLYSALYAFAGKLADDFFFFFSITNHHFFFKVTDTTAKRIQTAYYADTSTHVV